MKTKSNTALVIDDSNTSCTDKTSAAVPRAALRSWFVLYTKARYEFKVAQGIAALGLEVYCPMVTELKHYSDRKKKVQRPLLPSYVLVKLTEKERPSVFEVPGVVRYVFWLGKPAVVREEEVTALKNNINGVYERISITHLQKGDALEIPSGPFKGQQGTVITANKHKIKLALPGLGILVTLTQIAA